MSLLTFFGAYGPGGGAKNGAMGSLVNHPLIGIPVTGRAISHSSITSDSATFKSARISGVFDIALTQPVQRRPVVPSPRCQKPAFYGHF